MLFLLTLFLMPNHIATSIFKKTSHHIHSTRSETIDG
jgi:hypothetical protein